MQVRWIETLTRKMQQSITRPVTQLSPNELKKPNNLNPKRNEKIQKVLKVSGRGK